MVIVFVSQAQNKILKISRYFPKDAQKYKDQTNLNYSYGNGKYGKTELIIHCETDRSQYEFVLTKKIRSRKRTTQYKQGDVVRETFYLTKQQWEYNKESIKHQNIKSEVDYISDISDHDIYAFVLLQDHGSTVEKAVFKDFGNEVYWPEFKYAFCSAGDEDKDGTPEFYLSYYASSDGLDDQEFRQIIYTVPTKGKNFVKSKATGIYPVDAEEIAGNYRIEYDAHWKQLPEAIKRKSRTILKEFNRLQPSVRL